MAEVEEIQDYGPRSNITKSLKPYSHSQTHSHLSLLSNSRLSLSNSQSEILIKLIVVLDLKIMEKSANSKKRLVEDLEILDDVHDDEEEDKGDIRNRRSIVWNEMKRIKLDDKSKTKAKCNHYKQVITAKSRNGTSHLKRHLEKRDALKHYDEERKIVELDMQNALGRIFFTSDNWRNDHTQDEYICITAHWIDRNWKSQKRIIRFGVLTPPFDGITIAEDRQLVRNGKGLLFSGDFFQIHCCCHIINLIVQAGLRLIDDVVEKIRSIGKHFRHSVPKRKKFYQITQQTYHLDGKKRICRDCCVRWNSTYLMLDRALYFRAVVDHVVEKDIEIKMYLLDDDEWHKVLVIRDFLKVFYNITNEFSASTTPTSNVYFKGVWDIQCMLLETANGPHSFLFNMVKDMQKKFDKCWLDYNMLLSCACVLDPRYKLKFVEYCYTVLYGEMIAKEKVAEVRAILCDLLKEYRDVDGEEKVARLVGRQICMFLLVVIGWLIIAVG
ncbi:zinc finger BED domain-containing protein RICESLEEPER 2-like [Amaranthus tricolor]|uniref:zinc finger BED domain-containing protein RICESLEEPER 2-like n=1 Tax=Amaranthus tricolor TaxID=29722 RepID=UPI002586419B|nr:zinc finger BED domain-containing protein RICESLEEPER 2-like [Amaranthus tricolor]